jgi:fatty acid desaturase
MTALTRLRIPAEWYRPSPWWTVAYLVYAPSLVAVPAGLARWLAAQPLPLAAKCALLLPLIVVAGYGYQLMGFVGHEGMHLSLHRNKLVSACVGLFYASAVVSYFEMGFAAQHWSHHRYTNQKSDPDIGMVAHLDTWWKRLFAVRATYNLDYVRSTFRLARGGEWPFPYRLPFAKAKIRLLARLNFLFAALWLTVYIVIGFSDPLTALVSIMLPMVTALLISSCQPFLDHAGLGGELQRNAWSRTSPLMTAVYFGANYHFEHHLYPGVPCYRLGKVHRLLRDTGYLARIGAPVQPSFVRSYRAVALTYEPGRSDSTFDPFTRATS